MDKDTVIQWVEDGILRNGEKSAVRFCEVVLTYAELDAFSNRIAHFLVKAGVSPGDHVGICLDRSIELIATLLAILKTGAAYVPLDSTYPAERLEMMAEDAGLKCVVVHASNTPCLEGLDAGLLVWEECCAAIASAPDTVTKVNVQPEDTAYVIFTSGSTGRPKGIEMPHRALANLIEWQLGRSTFKPAATVLQYSSISFDVSFQEVATTLASGGMLVLISDDDRRDPRKLLDVLTQQEVGRLFLPYVAMRSLIQTAHARNQYPHELKEIITAGEQLRVDDAVRNYFTALGNASLDNQYGPSETHVITAHLLEGNPESWPDLPSIGTALKNCATFILDQELQPVPAGNEGELFLAGRNLAKGYVGREDLTREVFLSAPSHISNFEVLYKTGDLAAYNPDETIEFRGRRDHQIKVLGHRIEPGEINNAASQFPGIGQCVTHASKSADGMTRLATYYTVHDGASVSYADLRAHLDSKLPDYMVPAFLIELDKLPYTPSGKVDLKALSEPSIENSRYAGEEIRYETETEQVLSRFWKELLGLDGIPRTADFFELGGDSLRAVTLFLKIQEQFGCDLPLSTLLQASSIEALARHINDGGTDEFSGCRSLKVLQKGSVDTVPLFLVHGGAGNILCFARLAENLGEDQPVYAFQWAGWDGGRGENSIEEMAAVYRDELLKHFPDTPVRIGGYCIGGYIAIELTRLLRETGVKVLGPLVVFDSPNLRSPDYHANPPAGEREYKVICEKLAEAKVCKDTIAVAEPPGVTLPWMKRTPLYALARVLRTRKRLMNYDRDGRKGRAIPVDERNWYCAQTQQVAVKRHRTAGTDMPVLYFRSECQASEMLLTGWWSNLYMGFDENCHGGFQGCVIGGGHGEILDHPTVALMVANAFNVRNR